MPGGEAVYTLDSGRVYRGPKDVGDADPYVIYRSNDVREKCAQSFKEYSKKKL